MYLVISPLPRQNKCYLKFRNSRGVHRGRTKYKENFKTCKGARRDMGLFEQTDACQHVSIPMRSSISPVPRMVGSTFLEVERREDVLRLRPARHQSVSLSAGEDLNGRRLRKDAVLPPAREILYSHDRAVVHARGHV